MVLELVSFANNALSSSFSVMLAVKFDNKDDVEEGGEVCVALTAELSTSCFTSATVALFFVDVALTDVVLRFGVISFVLSRSSRKNEQY